MSLPPYTGRTSTPEAPAPPVHAEPSWPGFLSVVSLVGFAILVPWLAFFGVFANISLLGGTTLTDGEKHEQLAWAITGLVSGLLAVATAIVSIVGSRNRGARIASGVSIALGLIATLIFLVFTSSASAALPHAQAPVEPPVPACGPDSHPAVFGGDSRYTPCPEDEATAQALLDEVLPQLPTQDVTVASVEAVASQLHSDSYTGTVGFEEGTIPVAVAWQPAPVTCAIAQYREPTGWEVEVTGVTVDGYGCIYTGG